MNTANNTSNNTWHLFRIGADILAQIFSGLLQVYRNDGHALTTLQDIPLALHIGPDGQQLFFLLRMADIDGDHDSDAIFLPRGALGASPHVAIRYVLNRML